MGFCDVDGAIVKIVEGARVFGLGRNDLLVLKEGLTKLFNKAICCS